MIPADVASRLQSQASADVALRPVAPTQELTDKLSDLVAGQKVMAEIQAMLPNGTYRAVINQRNITLALPFSAKSGDSLELLVTESDGKIALAVVSHQEGNDGKAPKEAVSTTLSKTGQFISQLFAKPEESRNGEKALALNGNQPIAAAPPKTAQDILPLLKQAITQSGMFYESHQAEWVEGRFPQSALLQEPQGKLSSPAAFLPPPPPPPPPLLEEAAAPPAFSPNTPSLPEKNPTQSQPINQQKLDTVPAQNFAQPDTEQPQKAAGETLKTQNAGHLVAPQTQPIIQQQLDALATQNFAWQGQVWPGQEMRWEIEEDARNHGQGGEDPAESWRTRLKLTLPSLGGVNAQIQLRGEQLILAISVDNPQTSNLMQTESENLRQQLHAAGLIATSIGISEESAGMTHEEAKEQ